jgi:hypothetical protein
MILKFRAYSTNFEDGSTKGKPRGHTVVGERWVIYGDVTCVEYGDGEKFTADEEYIGEGEGPDRDRNLEIRNYSSGKEVTLITDRLIYDFQNNHGCPVYALVFFKQEGVEKVVATQLPVFLCNDKGDTIEKLV